MVIQQVSQRQELINCKLSNYKYIYTIIQSNPHWAMWHGKYPSTHNYKYSHHWLQIFTPLITNIYSYLHIPHTKWVTVTECVSEQFLNSTSAQCRLFLHLHLFVQEKQDILFSKTLTVEPDTQGTSVHW